MEKNLTYRPLWEAYCCQLGEHPASISLDLACRSHAPLPGFPHLIQVGIFLQDPDPIGMPKGHELSQLVRIEHAVREAVETHCQAILVGRAAFLGKRYLFFYAQTADAAAAHLSRAMAPFTGYSVDLYAGEESNWTTYFQFLWPDERELFRIESRKRFAELPSSESGPVSLLMQLEFPGASQLVDFSIAARSENLEWLEKEVDEEGRIRVRIRGHFDPDPAECDLALARLWDLASESGGRICRWDGEKNRPGWPNAA